MGHHSLQCFVVLCICSVVRVRLLAERENEGPGKKETDDGGKQCKKRYI